MSAKMEPQTSDNERESKQDHPDTTTRGSLDEASTGLVAIVMLALALAVFLSALDTTIVTTALPRIADHFQSAAGYTWIGSAYLLGNAASTPLWGKLADIFGRKPMLLVANAVFFIGSLVAALSNSIGMLIAARAIQGIGGAGLLVLVDIAISDLFSLRTRGTYLGIIGGVWAIAAAIGPVIGGALTAKVSWRWCFYINLPLDAVAFVVILFFLKLQTPKVPLLEGLLAIDWLGSLLIVGGTIILLIGLQYGGVTYPWSSAITLCLIIFGVLTMILFLIVEGRLSKYPLMQLSIFRNRSNAACLAFVFLHGFVFIAGFYYIPLYFQVSRGASALLSGVWLLPSAVTTGVSAFITGAFIGITGNYVIPIYIGALFMAVGFGLYINLDATSGWAKIIIYQIIAGIGMGPNFQAPLVALQTGINPRDIATSTATFNFLRQLANAISVVVGQVVFQNEMLKKQSRLAASLGPSLAAEIGGRDAAANTQLIDALPAGQKHVVQAAFANSLQPMWIMYTCFAGLACIAVLFIQKSKLSEDHEVQEIGLEAEKRHNEARRSERMAKKVKNDSAGPWS